MKRVIRLLAMALLLSASTLSFADGEHWTWNPNQYAFNSTFVAVINIDGEEQRSDQLEIGAFCDGECRGSVICVYEERKDRYFAYLDINGESGMVMNFRLWDHATDSELGVICGVTYTFEPNDAFGLPREPYVFPFNHLGQTEFNGTVNMLWSLPENWEGNAMPDAYDIVTINSPCQLDQDAEVYQLVVNDGQSLTVMDGYTLTVNSIVSDAATKLIVADGGQLVCDNLEGVFATIQKFVEGYGEGTDKWCFIASPLVGGTSHTSIDNLVNEEGYDLYAFDQTQELEWRNFKDHDLTLNPGEGYLYANSADAVLGFAGELNSSVGNVALNYGSAYSQAGWNLVGNPFTYNVYADRSYYVLNDDGTVVDPIAASEANAITPCTGILVKASSSSEEVGFSPTAPTGRLGNIKLLVSSVERGASSDCAIVSFDPDDALAKFVFQSNGPRLSIPQHGNDYAIVVADEQGELPVNFKADHNSTYSISVSASHLDMDYLHLIDNLTGNDVDLLSRCKEGGEGLNDLGTYTFEAKTSDYASRFRLVFSVSGDANDDNDAFAYISNGQIVITDAKVSATLQIVDVTGRIVVSCKGDAINHVSTSGMASGVYVLRLVDGDNVRVQKIMVR